ncbi:MAG: hypothetical protein M3Y34_07730, partial [Actinomycetota bacterium]|nr:hypothetical protein [Actinomycetota bacterium]
MTATTKNAVRVTIGGEEYTVRSELPPEYTREVAVAPARLEQLVGDREPGENGDLVRLHRGQRIAHPLERGVEVR